MSSTIPNSWKTVKLGDLLTEEQSQKVVDILNDSHLGHSARFQSVRRYLNTIKDDLERNGVLPDFLAYYLEFLVTQQQTKGQ